MRYGPFQRTETNGHAGKQTTDSHCIQSSGLWADKHSGTWHVLVVRFDRLQRDALLPSGALSPTMAVVRIPTRKHVANSRLRLREPHCPTALSADRDSADTCMEGPKGEEP
jgi:hypothetical protein